ncbi:MAG TPA: DoxX family protein [Polyangiaceae bacterium]|nr:DoxX family protein [Polyangiaceae bacterium]
MTSHVEIHHGHHDIQTRSSAASWLVPLGRLLFAFIFLMASPSHFSSAAIGYAASQGVPFPALIVPLSGILALVGGLLVAFGFHTRVGAWLLVLFLVPVTLMMHRFWAAGDPVMMRVQQAMFLKNVSMLGGALLLAYFGGGPHSMDVRHRR